MSFADALRHSSYATCNVMPLTPPPQLAFRQRHARFSIASEFFAFSAAILFHYAISFFFFSSSRFDYLRHCRFALRDAESVYRCRHLLGARAPYARECLPADTRFCHAAAAMFAARAYQLMP